MAKTKTIPNPGSLDAIAIGCTCSELANLYGARRPSNGWFVTATCPRHTLDGCGDFMDLPTIEVHRRNAEKVRALADTLDAKVTELEAKAKEKAS